MKFNFKSNVAIIVFWLLFFFSPILWLVFFKLPFDIGWLLYYYVFVLPIFFVIMFFVDIYFIGKNFWKISLFKYLAIFFASYVGLVIFLYFNIEIGLSL